MREQLSRLADIDVGPGSRAFYPLLIAGLLAAYYFAFAAFYRDAFSFIQVLANVAATVLLGLLARWVLLRFVLLRPSIIQVVLHPAVAMVFSLLLYWVIRVLLGVSVAGDLLNFTVTPFFPPAAVWQLFQGLAIYAAVALAVFAELVRARAIAAPEARSEAAPEASSRLFVRQDDEVRPLDPARIILARGADDYVEVVTDAGTHLLRITLAVLGERLGSGFIRVHRSCLVNADRIAKAEAAGGGRMLLHMDSGEMIAASRTGSRLLRERVV